MYANKQTYSLNNTGTKKGTHKTPLANFTHNHTNRQTETHPHIKYIYTEIHTQTLINTEFTQRK